MKQMIVILFSCLGLVVSAQKSASHLIIDSLQSQYLKIHGNSVSISHHNLILRKNIR